MLNSKTGTRADTPPSTVTAEAPFTDPVCGMDVDGNGKGYTRLYEGRNYRFCSLGCVEKFEAQPERFLKPQAR